MHHPMPDCFDLAERTGQTIKENTQRLFMVRDLQGSRRTVSALPCYVEVRNTPDAFDRALDQGGPTDQDAGRLLKYLQEPEFDRGTPTVDYENLHDTTGRMQKRLIIMPLLTARTCRHLRPFAFQRIGIGSESGCAVAPGPVVEGQLTGFELLHLAMPGMERRVLKSTSVRETDFPRAGCVQRINGVEMPGRNHIILPPGQEHNARNGRRDMPAQATQRGRGDLVDRGLFRAGLSGDNHVGFEEHLFQEYPLIVQSSKYRVQDGTCHFLAPFYRMAAVHKYPGFYDGDEACLLTKCRITAQCMCIHIETGGSREPVRNTDDGPPLREPGANVIVFLKPAAQAV